MRITRKLGILVAVPLAAVIAFATLAVATSGSEAVQAERLRGLVQTNAAVGELIQQVRTERSSGLVLLTSDKGGAVTRYAQDTNRTDRAIRSFERSLDELTSVPEGTSQLLDRVKSRLGLLDNLRDTIGAGNQASSTAAFVYRIVGADLLSYRESVGQAGGAPAEEADRLRAAAALSSAAEYIGLQEAAVLRAGESEELSSSAYQEITAARTGYIDAMEDFHAYAKPEWVQWVERNQNSGELIEAQKMERELSRLSPGDSIDVDDNRWSYLMKAWSNQLLEEQARIDNDITGDVTQLRDDQRWWTWAETAAVVLVVMAAVALAIWMGRPVVRGLRRLRDAAHRVASRDLPDTVAKFDDHEVLGEHSPDEFADSMDAPVEIKGKDELAEVGHAFNNVHREAVRVAAQQALLRLHIAAIFVNLARRGHSLAGRLTSEIDEAESKELDPERLERLFKLDHLVTLLGRSNDSLLVLGGASPAKVRAGDEPVRDVLTAAQSQIEQYTQIELGAVDDSLAIRAAVVDDVVKLLAELMDNAARYSQPTVRVEAHTLTDRLIIQITDEGIGIEQDKMDAMNARLAAKPPLDLEAVRAMGLTVVGHIAAQLNIRVQLRPSRTRGVIAEVTLPADLVTDEPRKVTPHAARTTTARRTARLFQSDSEDTPQAATAPEGTRPITAAPEAPAPATAAREASAPAIAQRPDSSSDGSGMMPVVYFDKPGTESTTSEHPVVPRSRNPFQEGWQAAEAAAAATAEDTDANGLPRRTPGDRLVPGGAEARDDNSNDVPRTEEYRDPAAVGATYAAFARGRPSGPRSSQSTTDRSEINS